MSLFQKSVEKKYLNDLDSTLIDNKYADFQSYFGNSTIQENIRNSKEEQFQEGFLRELFVSVLGRDLNLKIFTSDYQNITNKLISLSNGLVTIKIVPNMSHNVIELSLVACDHKFTKKTL